MPSAFRTMLGWMLGVARKAFRVGQAVVDRFETGWGHSQDTYAPEAYGNYLATSVAVYACAQLRAKNLASLPLRLWKTNARGERTEVVRGKLWDLLHKVNPFWTLGRLVRMTELSLSLWGQAYWVLERGQSGKGVPSEIWWVRPDRMTPIPDATGYLTGFVYTHNGERLLFRPDEVLWFRYDNPLDEFSGLSPIAPARLSIDTGYDALRSNRAVFSQGLQMAGLVTPENKDTNWTKAQTDSLREMLDRRFKGVDKAHKVAVLSHAAKFASVTLSPKDAEFLGLLKWSLEDVCRVYDVPLDLMGGQRTYENVDAAQEALWRHALLPEASMLGEEITEQLLPLFPGEADVAEFDASGVSALQEDRSEIVTQMHQLWQMGVPLNRLLQEFQPNLLPPGQQGYPWGEVGYLPMALQPAGGAPALPAPAAGEADQDQDGGSVRDEAQRALRMVEWLLADGRVCKAAEFGSAEHERGWKAFTRRTDRHEERVVETLRELFRRQQESVLARVRESKAVSKDDDGALPEQPFDKARWGKEFKTQVTPLFRDALEDAADETLEELRVSINFDLDNPDVVRWLERRAQRFARQVNDTTWDTLKRTLGEGEQAGDSILELAERVRQVFTTASTSRATMIARTEVVAASNAGGLLAAEQSGVVEMKEWWSSLDERVRETHREAHGQTRKLDEDFQVGNGSGPAPGQIDLAEEVVNCFPAGTVVDASGVERAYRRWYEGELVEITTSNGNKLTGTPNHPILTDRGWIPLGSLQKGDYVVCGRFGQDVAVAHPDVDYVQATIGEVFDLATLVGTTERRRGIEQQFHGDGQDSEVNVVTIEGELRNGIQSSLSQPPGQQFLALPDVLERLLSCDSPSSQFVGGSCLPPYCGMSGIRQAAALIRTGVSHANEHGSASVAQFHAGVAEPETDGVSGNSEFSGKRELTFTRQVALDQFVHRQQSPMTQAGPSVLARVDAAKPHALPEGAVVASEHLGNLHDGVSSLMQLDCVIEQQRIDGWAGHVYNLQTATGWYIANGIVAHNCRCTVTFILKEERVVASAAMKNGRA